MNRERKINITRSFRQTQIFKEQKEERQKLQQLHALGDSPQVEAETSVHTCLHVCPSQPSLKRRDGRGAPGSGGPGGRRQDTVQVTPDPGGRGGLVPLLSDWLTGSCPSRGEFLSLLRNYNCFLKEQTQLHLSYAHVCLLLLLELKTEG